MVTLEAFSMNGILTQVSVVHTGHGKSVNKQWKSYGVTETVGVKAVRVNGQITEVKQPGPWLIQDHEMGYHLASMNFSSAVISRNIWQISDFFQLSCNFETKKRQLMRTVHKP